MVRTQPAFDLLQRSVIVTGTHYSMTTLVGRLLATAPEFHILHEPTNPEPTLSYVSINPPNWYEFYTSERVAELADFLAKAIVGRGFPAELMRRATTVRSPRQALQVVRYCQRTLPMMLKPQPAVLKDPFLIFSAAALQEMFGMQVVLTIRHPCAFVESFKRAGHGFDFANLMQPDLLQALPEEAETIAQLAQEPGALVTQASHLWRIIYLFAVKYLVDNTRTLVLRQDQMVENTAPTIDGLFEFCGASRTAAVEAFLSKNLSAGRQDFDQGGSYIRRDGQATLNKWKNRLSPNEVSDIRRRTGEVAAQLGYDAESWRY
mgnify:CR=1 FL=1